MSKRCHFWGNDNIINRFTIAEYLSIQEKRQKTLTILSQPIIFIMVHNILKIDNIIFMSE